MVRLCRVFAGAAGVDATATAGEDGDEEACQSLVSEEIEVRPFTPKTFCWSPDLLILVGYYIV